jgi:hypothetical protein
MAQVFFENKEFLYGKYMLDPICSIDFLRDNKKYNISREFVE